MKKQANANDKWRELNGVMAEFRIHDTLCQVVSENQTIDNLAFGRQATAQVIGSCLLDGQRYLIVYNRACSQSATRSEASALEVLTRRELQVALMVCEGQGNKQIAYQLRLSEWTVSSYLRRIYTKLGVRTRAAMVARLITSMKLYRDLEA